MKKISFQNKIYTEKKLKYNVNTICSSEDGRKFTIEMQMENMGYYIERAVFYSSNVYIASYDNKKLLKDKKSKYSSLHPVYSINILNYKQFSDKEAIHIFNLYDSKHNMYLENVYGQNVLSIGFLELKKNDKTLSENMIYWIEFFKTEKTPEGAPEYIKKAAKLIFVNNFSKEERQMLNRIELVNNPPLVEVGASSV